MPDKNEFQVQLKLNRFELHVLLKTLQAARQEDTEDYTEIEWQLLDDVGSRVFFLWKEQVEKRIEREKRGAENLAKFIGPLGGES